MNAVPVVGGTTQLAALGALGADGMQTPKKSCGVSGISTTPTLSTPGWTGATSRGSFAHTAASAGTVDLRCQI